jgi:hypothetical protein
LRAAYILRYKQERKMNRKERYILLFLIFCSMFFISCSYAVDYIEGGITKRSSFPIDGSFSSGLVTILWDQSEIGSSNEAFAGYEIYVTQQPDNEFVGYDVIIAPYDLGQDILDSTFRRNTKNEISFNPVVYGLSGVYFFRLGIIEWDKKTKEERAGTDDDDEDTTGWMPYEGHYFQEYEDSNYDQYDENQWFYVNKTALSKISGSVMIDI